MGKSYEGWTPEEWAELDEDEKRPILDEFNADWRDDNGHLRKGHPGMPGTGKPKRTYKKSEYEDAIASVVTPERFAELLDKAYLDAVNPAKKTSKEAMNLLSFIADRLLGKPKQALEVTATTPEQWRAQIEDRFSREPVLLPGEDFIEADFRDVGENGDSGGTLDSGEGAG